MGTIILGSGIAGISAGYHLEKAGRHAVIYEKDSDWGGLCGNFTIEGFRFDKFVHFTFAQDEYISNIFKNSIELLEHIPFPSNYYKGIWIRHPAQNNLAPLSSEEKTDDSPETKQARSTAMHVATQQIEVQKVEHQNVEHQHIVQMVPDSGTRRIYLTPWMIFFVSLVVLVLMSFSYYLGYNRFFMEADNGDAKAVSAVRQNVKQEPVAAKTAIPDTVQVKALLTELFAQPTF